MTRFPLCVLKHDGLCVPSSLSVQTVGVAVGNIRQPLGISGYRTGGGAGSVGEGGGGGLSRGVGQGLLLVLQWALPLPFM